MESEKSSSSAGTYLARFGGRDAREAMDLAVEIGLRTTAARHRGRVTLDTLRECLHWVRGKAAQAPTDGFGNRQGDPPEYDSRKRSMVDEQVAEETARRPASASSSARVHWVDEEGERMTAESGICPSGNPGCTCGGDCSCGTNCRCGTSAGRSKPIGRGPCPAGNPGCTCGGDCSCGSNCRCGTSSGRSKPIGRGPCPAGNPGCTCGGDCSCGSNCRCGTSSGRSKPIGRGPCPAGNPGCTCGGDCSCGSNCRCGTTATASRSKPSTGGGSCCGGGSTTSRSGHSVAASVTSSTAPSTSRSETKSIRVAPRPDSAWRHADSTPRETMAAIASAPRRGPAGGGRPSTAPSSSSSSSAAAGIPGTEEGNRGLAGMAFWDTTGHVSDVLHREHIDDGPRSGAHRRPPQRRSADYYHLPTDRPVIPVSSAPVFPDWWFNAAPGGGSASAPPAKTRQAWREREGSDGETHAEDREPAGVPTPRARPFSIAEAQCNEERRQSSRGRVPRAADVEAAADVDNPFVRGLLAKTKVRQGMWDRHVRGESDLAQEGSTRATSTIREKRRDRRARRK